MLTMKDLGLLAVFIVSIVAGIFLIRALMLLSGILRDIKKLVRDNAGGIDKVMKNLPALSENAVNLTELASDVADNLKNEQELIETALESVTDTIESVSDTARAINEDFLGSIKRLVKLILNVTGLVSKKKTPDEIKTEDGVDGGKDIKGAEGTMIKTEDGSYAIKPERRERRAKKPRVRSAAVAARKRQAERGGSINIHIR